MSASTGIIVCNIGLWLKRQITIRIKHMRPRADAAASDTTLATIRGETGRRTEFVEAFVGVRHGALPTARRPAEIQLQGGRDQ